MIAELADRQHGVVATWQLREFGFTHNEIRYRAAVGRLHRIYQGVYAVGHRKLTPHGHRMAAVLAYGPDAVISHQTAAANWGIGPAVGDDPRYDANQPAQSPEDPSPRVQPPPR